MVGKADIAPLIGRFDTLANFIYTTKLFTRYVVDRLQYRRGTRLMMGNALIGRFTTACKNAKCRFCSMRRLSSSPPTSVVSKARD